MRLERHGGWMCRVLRGPATGLWWVITAVVYAHRWPRVVIIDEALHFVVPSVIDLVALRDHSTEAAPLATSLRVGAGLDEEAGLQEVAVETTQARFTAEVADGLLVVAGAGVDRVFAVM